MPIAVNPQSQKRSNESIGALFTENSSASKPMVFLKSSSDTGVVRNGGRNGARFAPASFLASFKKLTQSSHTQGYSFIERELAAPEEEIRDFPAAQELQAARILAQMREFPHARLCHLGGGHDHVYPLLVAASQLFRRIVVINLDAHADTRTDANPHSGTPFRQAARLAVDFHLFQVGLHPYANSFSTLTPLEQGEMRILWRNELRDESRRAAFFQQIRELVDPQTFVLFSLDADAMSADLVSAVSAVNHDGLSREELSVMWNFYAGLVAPERRHLGIYELNPIYDNVSAASMRMVSSFVFETL
jgi:formiminoglutamase